ncbi:hypothetical protein Tco_0707688 [Tanacetum coccineum]|uniref:Uncharacterized protein n=1 Tax=Tanacetum coccineum TaxID=301880 RepID=A0ABQ4YD56_9ASTR
MLTPKPSSYYTGLGSRFFANPKYLEKAQLEKPSLYNVKYDKNDLANLFAPVSKKTIRLAEESRSKLPNTANGSKPKSRNSYQQPRNWPPSMSSHVSNKTVKIAETPRNSKPFLNSKNLACPTCKKCNYSANYDVCILQYLSKIPIGQRFSPNKTSAIYVKTTPPRSGLTWKPTGRIFTYVSLRWIPTRKNVEMCINMNDSALPLRKKTYTPNTVICANSCSLSARTSMAFEPISTKGSTNVNIIPSSILV